MYNLNAFKLNNFGVRNFEDNVESQNFFTPFSHRSQLETFVLYQYLLGTVQSIKLPTSKKEKEVLPVFFDNIFLRLYQ